MQVQICNDEARGKNSKEKLSETPQDKNIKVTRQVDKNSNINGKRKIIQKCEIISKSFSSHAQIMLSEVYSNLPYTILFRQKEKACVDNISVFCCSYSNVWRISQMKDILLSQNLNNISNQSNPWQQDSQTGRFPSSITVSRRH